MNPLVSIAIPTFDRLHYLKEAVGSALSQTYGEVEILIGDDGSTAAIKEWGETAAGQDRRIRYHRNPCNLGLAGNWNALADAAQGEFLVIIGDDDRLLPHFVNVLVNAIQPGAHLAFANHYLINEHGHRLETESVQHTQYYRRATLPAGELTNTMAVVWQNSIPISATLMRTKDIQRLRFKEDLNTPEIELFIRLAQEGSRFVFVPDYLSEYRTHSKSATTLGLQGERLAEYLLDISVEPEIEPYKQEFMAILLVASVSRCLQRGEWERARRLLNSDYYPRRQAVADSKFYFREGVHTPSLKGLPVNPVFFLTRWAQKLCTSLPAAIGCSVYRFFQRIKSFS